MRVIIFGADKLGIDFYFEIKSNENVIAFIDNNPIKQGNEILGIPVLPAEKLLELSFDKIYIASLYHYKAIRRQIKELGIYQGEISYLPVKNYQKNKQLADDLLKFKNEKPIDSLYRFQELFREDEYSEKWKEIKNKYKRIFIYELSVEAIGEFIQRSFMAMKSDETDGNMCLRVFIPQTYTGTLINRISNKYLVKLLGRKIYIVQEKEVSFWAYVLRCHPEEVDTSEYDKYSSRNEYSTYRISMKDGVNCFTKEEIKEGDKVLEEIGVSKPYVCMAARTAAYNTKTVGHDFEYVSKNMNFDDYRLAIKYLGQKNIATVKMGRFECPMEEIENCVDYAGLYANDFRDLYLASRCEFFVSGISGIVFMGTLFAKPVLIVNSTPITLGYGGTPYTSNDLYIPKKYFDTNKKRYLSLKEMIKIESECIISSHSYKKMGIQFVDNSPEEIMNAVQEMTERLAGQWQDTDEDRRNYAKYLEIYNQMKKEATSNPDNWMGWPMPHRMASSYLRNNLYLLD